MLLNMIVAGQPFRAVATEYPRAAFLTGSAKPSATSIATATDERRG